METLQPMRTILVAVDFSDVTEPLVSYAVALGQAFGATVHFVHVEGTDPEFVGYEVGPQYIRDEADEIFREIRSRFNALIKQVSGIGVESEAHLLRGPTSETILHLAESLSVDLILIGSHGHGSVYSQLVGSVSERILWSTKWPVLVIPVRKAT